MRGGYRVRGGGGGASGPAGFTDSISLQIVVADSNAVPTDAATFQLNLLTGDTNAAQTDALTLNIQGLGDTNAVPTDSQIFTARIWLSASAGASVTNPSNADGQNDGTVATLQTALAGVSTVTMTSTLGANIPSGVVITNAIYRGWFKDVNTLVTSNGGLNIHSLSALFSDINMFQNSGLNTTIDHLSGDFTFDLIAAGINTLAKLQSIQHISTVTDAVAGVTPHVLTVDAGCIELAGAFT